MILILTCYQGVHSLELETCMCTVRRKYYSFAPKAEGMEGGLDFMKS